MLCSTENNFWQTVNDYIAETARPTENYKTRAIRKIATCCRQPLSAVKRRVDAFSENPGPTPGQVLTCFLRNSFAWVLLFRTIGLLLLLLFYEI